MSVCDRMTYSSEKDIRTLTYNKIIGERLKRTTSKIGNRIIKRHSRSNKTTGDFSDKKTDNTCNKTTGQLIQVKMCHACSNLCFNPFVKKVHTFVVSSEAFS